MVNQGQTTENVGEEPCSSTCGQTRAKKWRELDYIVGRGERVGYMNAQLGLGRPTERGISARDDATQGNEACRLQEMQIVGHHGNVIRQDGATITA